MKLSRIYLSLFCVAAISACGGGGSSSSDTNTVVKSLDVQAIDGYLKDATVWLDVDGDYTQDVNEPSAQTDGTGKATLDVSSVANPTQYKVLVKAIAGKTVDVGDGTGSTSNPITTSYTMSAPAGIPVVTPLTTLVEQKMTSGSMTRDDAAKAVAEQLGMSSDKASDLLKDFIQESNTAVQVYALNIVEALPETLKIENAESLLTLGSDIGTKLTEYLAANPLDSTTKPADIRVVLGSDGKVSEVIKDSNDDGRDDDVVPPSPTETLATLLPASNDLYFFGGSDNSLWTDHWTAKGSNTFAWAESNILTSVSQYEADPSMDEISWRLTANGWTEVKDSADMVVAANADGSVSMTDLAHAGKLSGSCSSVAGQSLSAVAKKLGAENVVASTATFSIGAEACLSLFTPGDQTPYRINTWTSGENSVHVNGQTAATTLDQLFSSTAPVASGDNAIATGFNTFIPESSGVGGEVRLVLVRANSTDKSGVAQLWQYNNNVSGYQLLSNITPADHQGWSLQTINGVELLTLSDAIRNFLGDEGNRAGYSVLDGRVQVVDYESDSPENIYFLNKTAYDDLMKGRTLVSSNTDNNSDNSGSSTYTEGTFALSKIEVLSPTSVKVSYSHTLYAEGVDMFEFLLTDLVSGGNIQVSQKQVSGDKDVTLTTATPLQADHNYMLVTRFIGDSANNLITNGVNGTVVFPGAIGSIITGNSDNNLPPPLPPTTLAIGAAAAAQFASLTTAQDTFYSFYNEQGNLGYTKVILVSNTFETSVYNYTTHQVTAEPNSGTGSLSVNPDNSVSLTANGSSDGSILCTLVLDLSGTPVVPILAPITATSEQSAMQSTFASATFSAGAKAYMTVHSYADSTDNELVLNEQAYQDLLKVMSPQT